MVEASTFDALDPFVLVAVEMCQDEIAVSVVDLIIDERVDRMTDVETIHDIVVNPVKQLLATIRRQVFACPENDVIQNRSGRGIPFKGAALKLFLCVPVPWRGCLACEVKTYFVGVKCHEQKLLAESQTSISSS